MKRPQEFNFEVKKTARYCQLGDVTPNTKRIWYVLHGYGQLASYFVRHFTDLQDEHTVVVAPEGLSRFYLGNNTWERVGASWMTKEDRLSEIEDYVLYLDQLHEKISSGIPNPPQTTVLGFSQGAATATRWVRKGNIRPANFVIWAGSIPEETDEDWLKRFRKMNLAVVLGDQDQYIDGEKAAKYLGMLRKLHPGLETFGFSGDHRMDRPTLAKVANFLESTQ